MDQAVSFSCAFCGAIRKASAKFCDQCGQAATSQLQEPAADKNARWYHNILFVLFMLFFVVGPFGLPLVWKNPKFSRTVKIILTLAMVVYTVLLIDLTLKMVKAVLSQVNQFNSTLPY